MALHQLLSPANPRPAIITLPDDSDTTRRVAQLLAFNDTGDILTLLKRRERSGDAWDLPGGGLEAGESYYDALVRETPEETRLCAPCVYPYFYTYEDGTDGKLAYAAMTFIAFYGDSYTPIVDGEEHAGFLWQPLDRLQSPRTRRFDTFLRESSIQQRGFTEIKAGLGGIRPLDMHLRGGATQPFPQPPF